MLAVAFSLVSQGVMAQANTRFNLVTDAYYGFPNIGRLMATGKALYNYPDATNIVPRGIGPTGLRTDFFIFDRVSIGADAIYSGYKVDYTKVDVVGDSTMSYNDTNRYSDRYNRLRVQGRVNFHFKVSNPHMDTYVGFAAGSNRRFNTRFIEGVETDQEPPKSKLFNKWTIPTIPFSARMCWGMRYYFTKNTGFNFEIGIGGPFISAGVSTRFGLVAPKMPAGGSGSKEGEK